MGEDEPITRMTPNEVAFYIDMQQVTPTMLGTSWAGRQALAVELNESVTLMNQPTENYREIYDVSFGLEFCDLVRRTGLLRRWQPVADQSPADAQIGDRFVLRDKALAKPFLTAPFIKVNPGIKYKIEQMTPQERALCYEILKEADKTAGA
jgi:hypothetical protein